MPRVTDLSALGWTGDRGAELPAGTTPGRVSRVDRGRLRVLTADGERTAVPAAALYDGAGADVGGEHAQPSPVDARHPTGSGPGG
jgi:hypothetical protein